MTRGEAERADDAGRFVRDSKLLSRVLRHAPGEYGLELDSGGWAPVAELLDRVRLVGREWDEAWLDQLVAGRGKVRFERRDDRVRAMQGHSWPIDLGLESVVPPRWLFHGTAATTVQSILADGLRPGGRQHVHLSIDPGQAREVGARHGPPVVLRVASGAAAEAGRPFWLADNGVWLTQWVAPEYLAVWTG